MVSQLSSAGTIFSDSTSGSESVTNSYMLSEEAKFGASERTSIRSEGERDDFELENIAEILNRDLIVHGNAGTSPFVSAKESELIRNEMWIKFQRNRLIAIHRRLVSIMKADQPLPSLSRLASTIRYGTPDFDPLPVDLERAKQVLLRVQAFVEEASKSGDV